MSRAVLMSCLPWLGLLLASCGVLWLLARGSSARFEWGRLRRLHDDQVGGAQTLSFVLTLPLFVCVMLFIVQVSQLMIGQLVVEYAAFAAARSAIVWIPAKVGADLEPTNCVVGYDVDLNAPDQVYPILDPNDPNYGPAEGGVTYVIRPDGAKYRRVLTAALLAVMPVCPSRDLGIPVPSEGIAAAEVLKSVYRAMVPSAGANTRIDPRIENKLAYACQNTSLEMRFYHTNRYPEPPLMLYDLCQFRAGRELGWQDTITVKVHHNLALLPGPGRMLARPVPRPDGSPDTVASTIGHNGRVYVYPLTASATLGNEGEESVIRYEYHLD